MAQISTNLYQRTVELHTDIEGSKNSDLYALADTRVQRQSMGACQVM